MEVRGTPGLGRIFALPISGLVAAAVGGSLLWAGVLPDRRFGIAAIAAGIFGLYSLVRSLRQMSAIRQQADDWLRTATTGFVPKAHAWRAAQLRSPRQRRTLARTLRAIEETSGRPLALGRPRYLRAVRAHRESVELLVQALESVDEPVTPAGILRVRELISEGASPLWGTTNTAALDDAISKTLALLTRGQVARAEAA
jgi:hypothetical protein